MIAPKKAHGVMILPSTPDALTLLMVNLTESKYIRLRYNDKNDYYHYIIEDIPHAIRYYTKQLGLTQMKLFDVYEYCNVNVSISNSRETK